MPDVIILPVVRVERGDNVTPLRKFCFCDLLKAA
jgi:hypothetical protein